MSLKQDLEISVDNVLNVSSVSTAQKVLQSRSGLIFIALVSFMESALPLPILTDPFLVAAILANRSNTLKLVIMTTTASVLGGVCAYLVASFFFETLLQWLTPGMLSEFNSMVSTTGSNAFIMTLVGAITPVPYTIVAWVIAVIEGGITVFITASVLGRGLRYSLVGFATYRFGPLAISYARRYVIIASVILIVLIALYVWLKM